MGDDDSGFKKMKKEKMRSITELSSLNFNKKSRTVEKLRQVCVSHQSYLPPLASTFFSFEYCKELTAVLCPAKDFSHSPPLKFQTLTVPLEYPTATSWLF